MSDEQAIWQSGVVRVDNLLAGLSGVLRQQLLLLLLQYQELKSRVVQLSATVDASKICAGCGGACCANGKYRFSVLDVVALVSCGVAMTPDYSQKPLCPYGGMDGCLLEPRFRPLDCVLFVCEDIDVRLTESTRQQLAEFEVTLRQVVAQCEQLLAVKLSAPLLLWEHRSR